MATAGGESFFKNGIDKDIQRKQSGETVCSVLLYLALLIQVIMSVIILASKNTEVPSDTGVCPGDMVPATFASDWRASRLCVSQSLYEDWQQQGCRRRLDSERQLQVIRNVPGDTWEFLETYPYQPSVLFACVGVLALLWLYCQLRAAKATIWGVIVTAVLLLAAVFVWFWIDFEVINWACVLGIVGIVAGALVLRPKIGDTAVIMSTAMEGLRNNAYVFAIGFALQAVWVAYLALWIASVVGMHFVFEVAQVDGMCVLQSSTPLTSPWLILYFLLCYYWLTSFLQNSTLIPAAASLGGWYFQQQNWDTFWRSALQWSFWNQAGGNAMASAIMGFSEYLLSSISSGWRLCISLFMPWNWILICLAFALKTLLQTYGKFGLIAMTFSGKTFCESASRGFELLKGRLGDAVLTDHLGQAVMAFATYIISLGVFLASWAWADDLQNYQSFQIYYALPLAFVLSCPLFSLFVVVFIEYALSGVDDWDPEFRAVLNSILVSLFLGSITMFILTNVSKIVVGAMDTVFFCFAIEQTNGANQERFKELYASIKNSLAQGGVAGNTVVAGQAAASPPPQAPPGSAPVPVQVMGQPVTVSVATVVPDNNADKPEV